MVKKPLNSVKIGLLNFSTDKDIESFLEFFFIEDKNFFEREITKFSKRRQKIIE